MTDYELTLRAVLNKIADERNHKDCAITIQETTSDSNFTSKLYTAVISSPNAPDLHLFGKVAALSKELRDYIQTENSNTEFYFYTNLLKRYREIEDDCKLPAYRRLKVPEFYGFDPTEFKETIVLENLSNSGYTSHKASFILDWDHAKTALLELAKFHALSFAYKAVHPEEYQTSVSNGNINFDPDLLCSFVDGPIAQAMHTVKPEYKVMLKRYIDIFMKQKMKEQYKPLLKPVICHLDYRGSNLMYKRKEDGGLEVTIVDFQTLREASPVTDLLYFIFTGSDEQFRAEYFDKLTEYYYVQLCDTLHWLNIHPIDVYSRADFEWELKERLPFGLSISIMSLPIISAQIKKAEKQMSSGGSSSTKSTKSGDVYSSRLHGVINDFVKWGILK